MRSFDVSLICARINGWVNNGKAGDLRRHRAHYYVIVMCALSCTFRIICPFHGMDGFRSQSTSNAKLWCFPLLLSWESCLANSRVAGDFRRQSSIGSLGIHFREIIINNDNWHTRKWMCECRLQNGSHFISAPMCTSVMGWQGNLYFHISLPGFEVHKNTTSRRPLFPPTRNSMGSLHLYKLLSKEIAI